MRRIPVALLLVPVLALGIFHPGGFSAAGEPGSPTVVEFPSLADLGDALDLPAGWTHQQATAETFDDLSLRYGVVDAPVILILDQHGNVLLRDAGAGCRQRTGKSIQEFRKRQAELISDLSRNRENATRAAREGKDAREIEAILDTTRRGLSGYADARWAHERLRDLESRRLTRLIEVLAGEGIESSGRLEAQLRSLLKISAGLRIERRIRREIARLDAGVTVRRKKGVRRSREHSPEGRSRDR